jgi:predicted metalloprotease with PDZ domain
MKRSTALLLSMAAALIGGLALGSGGVQAREKAVEETDDGEKIEKRVEIVRLGGGRAFLGVRLEDVEGDARGAKVRTVEPDSAAEKAGVEDGDVIVRFDGEAVRSARQLARLVRETPVGRAVDIEVERGGATRTLTATLADGPHRIHRGLLHEDESVFVPDLEDLDIDIEVPEGLPAGPGPHVFRWHGDDDHDFTMSWFPARPRLGVGILNIDGQLAEYFGVTGERGVLVSSVREGSPADEGGLQTGDVILEFDGKEIRSSRDLRKRVREAKGGSAVAVKVLRDEKPRDVQVVLPEVEEPKPLRRHTTGVSL